MCGIEWCAGLFVGEGSHGKRVRDGSTWLSIGMRDEEAMKRFSSILSEIVPIVHIGPRSGVKEINVTQDSAGMWRIHSSGTRADAMLAAMSPYLTTVKRG